MDLVKQADSRLASYLNPNNINNSLAYVIAKADQYVDEGTTLLPFPGLCVNCHFMSWTSTIAHVNEAIKSRNPYLFGATLHQVQDYFSHWREGYRPPFGHGAHTVVSTQRNDIKYSDFFNGGHYVQAAPYAPPIWVEASNGHLREDVIQDIRKRNPGFDPSNLSDDEVMNLYLRRDPEYANADERFEDRNYYGIDPDMYLPGTYRDRLMEASVKGFIKMFFDEIGGDPCNINWDIPEDSTIEELLRR